MKRRIFYSCLLIWLCLAGLISHSFAQTVTSVTFPAATVCPGSGITVTFATSSSFTAGNVFTAYLSDPAGFTYPTVIGTVTRTTGGTIAATIPANAVDGSTYRIQVRSSTPATLSSSLTTLTISRPAAPAVTNPAAYCEGATPASLSPNATAATGGTLNWYGPNATGGTASATPTVPSTTVIGPTNYYVSQSIGGCESARVPITVTVNATPGAPSVSPVSYCVGQTATALTATPVSGATLNWYGTNATGGTATSVSPIPSTTIAGSNTYYVSQSVGSCQGPRIGLTVTVNSPPTAPTFPASATYCQGAPAVPLSATGQNLRWYGTNETGGTPSVSATVPGTTVASIGTILYYVSQTVLNCEGPRAAIPVTVRPNAGTPATTPVPDYCQSQTASPLVATAATGATLNWYGPNATGGTASATPTIPSTTIVGPSNYYVSQTVNGCESVRVAMTVTVKPTPVAPGIVTPLVACQNRTGYALTATPSATGTLNWYGTAATGGTPTATPAPLSTTAVGSLTYYVSQSINGCEGPRAGLTVTVNAVPAVPTLPASPTYCEGVAAPALSATGTSLRWYGTSPTGVSFSPNPTVPSTAAAAIGTTTYYVTQTVAGCESDRAGIPVLVKDTPDAPGTAAIDFCQGTPVPVLNATPIANASLNWYGTSQTGGMATATAPVPTNTTVGTTVYYVSQTLVGCEGPRANLSVRVKATPAAPGVSPISFCNNGPSQQLTASGSGLIKWYDASDNALAGIPTPNTGSVGNQTFKVSQTSSENCEGPKASLVVTINALPGQPSVAPLVFCQAQQDQPAQNLSPLSAGGQNLKWFNANSQLLPNAPIPTIDRAGKQVYQVSQTVNNCEGAKASLEVSVITPPAPALPKSLLTYCINDRAAPLEAIGETGSQLRWIDPYGNISGTAPTPSTLNTNIKPNGDEFYVYQIASYGCYSARSTIRVVVNTTPTLSILAPTGDVNLGQRAPLQLKFTGSGPYSYSITGGYAGTSRTDTTISVLPRGNTTYQVAAVTNGCGVGLPGNPASAIITVRVPTIVTSSLTATTLCAGTTLTVPFTTTGDFNTGNAFRIELVSSTDTTKKFAIPASANSSPVTGPIPLSLTSGQYLVRVKADNPEIAIIGSNSSTVLTLRTLPSATLTGAQNIYEGSPANLTVTFGGDGPWTIAYADSIRSYSATALTSPYVIEARPVRTTTYRLTGLTNSCGTGPLSGTATITVLPLLGVDDNSLDPLVKTYPVPTETTLMVELNLPLIRDPATLTLTDLKGQPIIRQTTRTRLNEMNLTTQPNGLYLLRIQVGDRQTVRKVLKQ